MNNGVSFIPTSHPERLFLDCLTWSDPAENFYFLRVADLSSAHFKDPIVPTFWHF